MSNEEEKRFIPNKVVIKRFSQQAALTKDVHPLNHDVERCSNTLLGSGQQC